MLFNYISYISLIGITMLFYNRRYNILSTSLNYMVKINKFINKDNIIKENEIYELYMIEHFVDNISYKKHIKINLLKNTILYNNKTLYYVSNENNIIKINEFITENISHFILTYVYNENEYKILIKMNEPNEPNEWSFPPENYKYDVLKFICPNEFNEINKEIIFFTGPKSNFYSDTKYKITPYDIKLSELKLSTILGENYYFKEDDIININ